MSLPFGEPCDVCGTQHEDAAIHLRARGGWWLLEWSVYDELAAMIPKTGIGGGKPSVDLDAELLKMRGWLDANPRNLKTPRGMRVFVTRWLNRAIERAESRGAKT